MTWRGTLPAACWEAHEAPAIIPVEAESTSNGVFLATHTSIPILLRDRVDSAVGGTIVNEHNLRRAVEELPADQPIIPILGKSGTGKSHLIRWLRINLKPNGATRLIFVPKHRMSLRGILELILEHATSERAAELRAKVAAASDAAADETTAQLRLRNELAVLVETRGADKDGTPEENDLRAFLASAEGLPALLGDPVFRRRLLADNGPIARLVREKLSGKGAEDKEDAFGFTAADLDLSVDDVSKAGVDAASVASALASDAPLRDLAAKMLNEQLGPAVSEVFGIGGDDLKQLLVELRLDLQRQGLELLLLIEDFSIFQGIQGGLIDAITLLPTETLALCPMRVVMAVTTGYFVNQMPETVYTRTYKVFDLELPADKTAPFDPARFAARYLNAVRVGSQEIDKHRTHDGPEPNHCLRCPVQEKCHQAFGEVEGVGLFPFSRTALDRAIRSQSKSDAFIARDVLTRVLRPVLHRDQTELDEGRFPSTGFESDFRTGALDILDNVEDQVRLRTPGDPELSERRVRMVRFWGPGHGPQNLHPTIHEAFAIPPLPDLITEKQTHLHETVRPGSISPSDETEEAPAGSPSLPPSSPLPAASKPPLVRAVDEWHKTGELLQRHRNDLRNIVHTAVIGYLGLEDGYGGDNGDWTKGGAELAPSFDAKTSIALDGSALQTALISIDHRNVEDVRVLRALAWLNAKESWEDVPQGDALQILCVNRVQEWADSVSTVLLPSEGDDAELGRLAHALLSVSKALGIADSYKGDALSRVKALFAGSPKLADPVQRPHMRKLQDRLVDPKADRNLLQQRLLRLTSYRQGAGKPLAIDLPRLVRAMRDDIAEAPWPEHVPEQIRKAADDIQKRTTMLDPMLDETRRLAPDVSDLGGDVAQVAQALNTLLSDLAALGQSANSINLLALHDAAKSVKPSDLKKVTDLREGLDAWPDLTVDQRLRLMNLDERPALRIRAWLDPTLQAVNALELKLQAGPASEAQREYDETIERLVSGLATLSREVMDVTGPEGGV
ncbi:protein DpdH [Streptomyces sp. NBC_01571]|uniref:protein DpdH n=1 Tax=Streptomyces sp. NBC_01571 TaxID=2975883 RepID=UPI00225AE32A|nr:protein DpdH [Streptomyces sp. NBC_01571]MCX4577510.1 protein DpdH [Streptomyces sp. NBC_01571]